MKHKGTCFLSTALAVLMAVSSVAGSAVNVFAAGDSEAESTETIRVADDTTDNDIVIVEDDSAGDEIVIEAVEEEPSASVSLADTMQDESGIKVEGEKEYQAGDAIPLNIEAENPTEEDVQLRLYFWDYSEELPSDRESWSDILRDACADVQVSEFKDTEKMSVELTKGTEKVTADAEWIQEKDTEDVTSCYMALDMPAQTSGAFTIQAVSENAETVTVVPVMVSDTEEVSGNALQMTWAEAGIVIEETEDTEESIQIEESEEIEVEEEQIVVETEEPSDSFASVYLGDDVKTDDLNASDFASMRLVVLADDESVIVNDSDVIGQYDNVYLLQFTSIQQTMNAYAYYKDKVTAVEPDATVEAAEENGSISILEESSIPMSEEENPILALNDTEALPEVKEEHGVIALIDTGVKEHANVMDRVSVIDDVLEGNGHGDDMLEAIVSQDVDAKVLSIRAMDDNGFGTVSSLVAAMEYAMEQDVDMINLSLYARTTLSTSVLKQEIQKATDAGILVVGAAGNDGVDVADYVPGSVEEAYIIGAANEDGSRLKASNFGATVDYNVVADSTSKAAALFTGFVSANGLDAVPGVLNQGLIYATDYKTVEEEEPAEEEDFSDYTLDTSKTVTVKYLFADTSYMEDGDTIDSLYDKYMYTYEFVLGTFAEEAELYAVGDGTYKFKADGPLKNGCVVDNQYADVVFARSNANGEVVTEGVNMDASTGVATVTEEALQKKDGDFSDIQVQILVPMEGMDSVTQDVKVENADDSVYDVKISAEPFGYEVIPLAVTGVETELESSDFEVYLNDNQVPASAVWDEEEKSLSIYDTYAIAIHKIRIKVKTDVDSVFQVAATKATTKPMFYLPDGTDVSTLKVKTTSTVNSAMGVKGYEDWASALPKSIIGTNLNGVTGYDHEKELMGYIGIPKTLFGIDFNCVKKTGKAFGKGYWDAGTTPSGVKSTSKKFNAGIGTACVHAAKKAAIKTGTRMKVKYTITKRWTEGEYTYFNMTMLGKSRNNGNPLGQTMGAMVTFAVKNNQYGYLKLKKGIDSSVSAADKKIIKANTSYYTLANATYTVYKTKSGDTLSGKMGTLTTDASGNSTDSLQVPVGANGTTYYIKETKAPKGYKLNSKIYSVKVTVSHTSAAPKVANVKDIPKLGNLKVQKASANPDVTDNNNCYSFEGAEFTIYTNSACTKAYKTIKTNKSGVATLANMPLGAYWVKETKAPEHYQLNTTWKQKVTIKATHTASAPLTITCKDEPGNDPNPIVMKKIWHGDETPTIPSLAGTQFTIKYYDNMDKDTSGKPLKTWVIEVKKVGNNYFAGLSDTYLVKDLSDDLYKNKSGNVMAPYGTYSIQETKSAPAYTLEGELKDENGNVVSKTTEPYITVVDGDNGYPWLQGGNEYTGYNETVDTSIKIVKYDHKDKPLAGVTFKLTDSKGKVVATETTGEDGIVHFKELYPDRYTVTEIKTAEGESLLAEPFVIETPTRVTEEDIETYNIDKDKLTYDPYEDIYYIFDLTYEVGNDVTFTPPMTGGFTDITTFLPLIGGMGIFGSIGAIGYRRRKKQK